MPEKYALLIGCNYLQTPESQLYGCINDIQNMSKMLITNMGFKLQNITMLRDDISNNNMIPTKNVILRELNNIIQKSATAAEIWIHYSGHGSQVVDQNYDETSGYDSCIVPADYPTAGFIIDDDLLKIISQSKCPTMILSDSCHSGTVCDLPYSIEYLNGSTFKYTKNNIAAILNPNIVMFSGCKDVQTSADFYDGQHNQSEGAFTDSFLRALKTNNYNAKLTKIYVDVLTWLKQNGFSQKPILSSSTSIPSWTFGIVNSNVAVVSAPPKKRPVHPKKRAIKMALL